MNIPRSIRKLWYRCLPHYLIIGRTTKEVIGCTCGRKGQLDVLAEEPGSTFQRCSRRDCPICNEED